MKCEEFRRNFPDGTCVEIMGWQRNIVYHSCVLHVYVLRVFVRCQYINVLSKGLITKHSHVCLDESK